jgi:hypothetical protein
MEKATTIALVGAILVLVGAAFYVGRVTAPKPQPQVIEKPIDLTQAQRDSLDNAWREKFAIIKRGKIIHKNDTTFVEDSTTIRGLYSLIEALTQNQAPVSIPQVIVQPGATVPSWGLSVGVGGMYHFKDAGIMPLGSLSIKHKKNSIHPLIGYYKGLMCGILYERQF